MNAFCPNLSNKQVKQEFEELVNAVGENAAYYLWNKNNGYSLDKAPNGAESKLFSNLLEEYNGDRILTIKDIALTKTNAFESKYQNPTTQLIQEYKQSRLQYVRPELQRNDVTTKSAIMNLSQQSQFNYYRLQDRLAELERQRTEYINLKVGNKEDYESLEDYNRAKYVFRNDYNIREGHNQISQIRDDIALSHNMVFDKEAGYFKSTDSTENKDWMEHFVNSLSESTWKAYIRNEHVKNKYKSAGWVENLESLPTLLWKSLLNGDIATIDENLARDYVRMFWNTSAVQHSLKALDKGKTTSKLLEDALIKHLIAETREEPNTNLGNVKNTLKSFWDNLKIAVNKLMSVFSGEEFKSKILDNIQLSFQVFYDLNLTKTNVRIYDRMRRNFSSSGFLSEKDKKLFESIKRGTKVRLESQLARNTKNNKLIADLKSRLEIINDTDEDSIDDVFDILLDFLITAQKEIGQTRYYIDNSILNIPVDTWDPVIINQVRQDLIGFYENLLTEIYNLFTDKDSNLVKFANIRAEDPHGLNLSDVTNQLLYDIDNLRRDYYVLIIKPYTHYVLENFIDEEESIVEKDIYKKRIGDWIEQNGKYGDLATGEVWTGMASRSKSLLIKIVDKMIADVESEHSREVLKRSQKLVTVFKKCRGLFSQVSPFNFQKMFMEMDKKGVPTGYFIREINEGQAFLDKDAKEAELRAKYGLIADEEGNTIFPEEDAVDNNSVYNRYMDELDEWLDKHFNRRYTLEYYKARRRFLSPATQLKLNQLQRQIDLVRQKGMADGFFHRELLSKVELRQLDILNRQKRSLREHYVFNTTSTGILTAQEKDEEGLKIADEIAAWNKWKRDKLKYKSNWKKFNEVVELMKRDGKSEAEINQFIKDNKKTRISKDFWRVFSEALGKPVQNEEYEKLKRRYNEIINQVKPVGEYYSPNLNLFGTGLNMDSSIWLELARLEQEMSDLKSQLFNEEDTSTIESRLQAFLKLATTLPVISTTDNKKSVIREILDIWGNAVLENPALLDAFNKLFLYRNSKGQYKYLRAFEYLAPISRTILFEDEKIDAFEEYLVDQFSDIDTNSELANKDFDPNGRSLLPKAELYRNKDFDKIKNSPKLMELYNAMLDFKHEADAMIPNKALYREMMLPQVSGRMMSIFGSSLKNGEIFKALGYPILDTFTGLYAESKGDVEINTDNSVRPDGSRVENIPVRFVDRLKNRVFLSTDVIGSLILYYDSALNYKMKSGLLPAVEIILETIDPKYATGTRGFKNQYEKLENMLSQRFYGHQQVVNTDYKGRFSGLINFLGTFKKFTLFALLAGGIISPTVGYISANVAMIAEAIGGKSLTFKNYLNGILKSLVHVVGAVRSLGKQLTRDKMVAAMQYNGLSKSNSEIFGKTDKSRLTRFISDHLLMGGYTLGDYAVNCVLLCSLYDHYKLIIDINTNKPRFMSRQDVINMYTKEGYTEKVALEVYNKSKVTMWDVYYVDENGVLAARSLYKDAINKKLENRILQTSKDLSALYNGTVPISERAKIQQNVFASYITLMRNYAINDFWSRFNTQVDEMDDNVEGGVHWYSAYTRDDLVGINLRTGVKQGAMFKDFIRGMYKLASNFKNFITRADMKSLTKMLKYAVKNGIAELVMITLFGVLSNIFTKGARDDDKNVTSDPAWTLNLINIDGEDKPIIDINLDNAGADFTNWAKWALALVTTRVFIERVGLYWPSTITEIISTPSSAKAYLDNVMNIWDVFAYLFEDRSGEEITNGGYQHMSRGTKALCAIFSATGINNFVKTFHTSGLKSTYNWYRKTTPTDLIIPTLKQYNEKYGSSSASGDDWGGFDDFGSDDFSNDFGSDFE